MLQYDYKEINNLLVKILRNHGVLLSIANKVAKSLLENEVMGYRSHGIIRIMQYIDDIKKGLLDIEAKPIIDINSKQVGHIDGNKAFGNLVVNEIITQIKMLSKKNALCAIHVTNSHHVGRLYKIGFHLAKKPNNLFIIGFCNYLGNGRRVAPPGVKSTARLCTNPMLFAVPTNNNTPFVLDISTSTIAEGSIAYAKLNKRKLSKGILVDHNNEDILDPNALYTTPPKATITPLGYPYAAHKGYGLAVFVEAIVGTLANAGNISLPSDMSGNGLFILAINPTFFSNKNITSTAKNIIKLAYEPYESNDEYRYPGSKSKINTSKIKNQSLYISKNLYQQVKKLAMTTLN
ncbi:MAG: hypothetical protein A3E87_05460 [Gammaproteobacteria bacterium RIFCSPHIGHO2_12_FULL_35_23]|nr:MAG: hypothetical protein A3E87_05460 [Gammaproteobacteria bacterium RIFCSPHIGHO2_12_FULL_35_23]